MITVFTPTFNRSYTLGKLYKSLVTQCCKDFEWIVIDDGSTDNTEQLFEQWRTQTSEFSIVYEKIKNGGKHRAINRGVKMARGEAFFIVDSDDYLADNAIAFVKEQFAQITYDERFAGISGLKCSYADGSIIGGPPSFTGYVDATNLERNKYHLSGDKAEIYKTNILKRYPFPEYENENFLTEGVVWDSIALDGYMIRWFTTPLYYCEYLNDGLSKNAFNLFQKNPLGWAHYIRLKKKCESQTDIFLHMYKFFECMHFYYDEEKLKLLLEIDKREYDVLSETWDDILVQLKEKIKMEHICTLAIYGAGNYAKRLQLYLNEIDMKVAYYIDKGQVHKKSPIPVYTIDMELPLVDSICITSDKISKKWEAQLKQKLPDTKIWRVKELSDTVWM